MQKYTKQIKTYNLFPDLRLLQNNILVVRDMYYPALLYYKDFQSVKWNNIKRIWT